MEEAGKWAFGVCACAIAACIVEMLSSDTRLEKNVRFILGTVMLCAVILPLGNVIRGAAESVSVPDHPENAALPEKLSQSREEYLKKAIKALISDTLSGKGIRPVDVCVSMDIDDTGCIKMITAELMISRRQADRASQAAAYIKEELGIACKTIITDQ